MTRILTITTWYPPHHFGGYELSCFDVMTRFVDRGHDVRILCGDELLPGAPPATTAHEERVFRELRPHWRERDGSRPPVTRRLAMERHNRTTLERHLGEFRPDVVSVWHMVAISAGLLVHVARHDVPAVYVVCDDWPVYVDKFDGWMSLFGGGRVRSALGGAVGSATGLPTRLDGLGTMGTFCFVSDAMRTRVTGSLPDARDCSGIVYSGIEAADFPSPQSDASQPWGWRLLYVGRLDATKGVDTLVRALAHLPAEATLECYGRGGASDRERLTALAASLGVDDRVVFGSLERSELSAKYQSADVVVFPSEWDEPFGLVPVEAMASGTPVVATGVGGSREFLRDGFNCVLFPPGDAEALAATVCRVRDDGALRQALEQGGRHTADQLGVDRLADALEEWHVAAADRFTHGRPGDRILDLPPATPALEPKP
jgi:glycosyltransferase involved in cell wall biosynthesis